MTRARIAIGIAAAVTFAAGVLASCAVGGRVVGQRTFLWHSGNAVAATARLPLDAPNPFRGRVAPTKARRGSFASGGIVFFDDLASLRHFEGSPFAPPGAQVEPLDPTLGRIFDAPATVLWGLVPASYTGIGDFVSSGILLADTFPSDFGGDFSGDVFCVDPFSIDAQLILSGQALPPSSADCIGGSVDVATGDIFTRPSIVRITGGDGELPFRPAPDRASSSDPSANGGSEAQGLYYPSSGWLAGSPMQYERNVDPGSGLPLVARLGSAGIGTCAASSAGAPTDFLVPASAAAPSYSTAFASHPLSVTTGVSFPILNLIKRGGIGTDPGCLRPGGARRGTNALSDFADGIDDDLPGTNALARHHANQGLFAFLCRSTLNADAALPPGSCLFTQFNTGEAFLPSLVSVPFSELLAVVLAGDQSGQGPPAFLSRILGSQKFAWADTTPPLVSLNRLFNDPAAPLLDRNGDGGFGDGPMDAADCASSDPATSWSCDLRGFDGFDGRVALITLPATQRPDGSQKVYQTLDDSLTNEQRALGGCGPFYGIRCDSAANVNPLLPVPGDTNRNPTYFAAAGGLDLLNAEASALLESTRDPNDAIPATTSDPQPGTVAFADENRCLRRLAGGQLVRLPGCRGIESYSITSSAGVPTRIDVVFEADYLPSADGCIIGSRVLYAPAASGEVPVFATGGAPGLQEELPLCNGALRSRAVPRFQLTGYAGGVPALAPNPDATGSCAGGAFFGAGEPGTPPVGSAGVTPLGSIDFRWCESELVPLEELPLIHPIAGCADSDIWFDARADDTASDTGLPYGGCEFFYERDLVQELFDGTAQLFRSEFAAVSWNLVTFLAATSCDERTPDASGQDHRQPPPGMGFPVGAVGALRADPRCFDAERPWSPGRCSYATPQLCKNVIALLGAAPRQLAAGGIGDDDIDGVAADGDGSGITGDRPCRTGEVLGCDDNCVDLSNRRQVNSNGFGGAASDGVGNLCDPDLDNDGDVDLQDRALQDGCFLTGTSATIDCADADLVGGSLDDEPDPDDPAVNGFDRLQLLRWLRDPGSAPGTAPN